MKNYSAAVIFFGTILSIVVVSCSKDIPSINNASETHSSAVANTAMAAAKNGDPYIRPETTSTYKKAPLPIIWPDTSKVNTH